MNKKAKRVLSIVICIVASVGIFFSGYFTRYCTTDKDLRAVYDVLSKYKKYYYYDDDNLTEKICDSILDKFSDYYTKEEMDAINEQDKGNYEGVGVSIVVETMQIDKVMGNSPCENAGVLAGGIITDIKTTGDFINIYNYSIFAREVSNALSSTPITLKIKYGEEIKEFVVYKKEYKQTYVHYYDNTGSYGFSDKSGKMEFVKISDNTVITNEDTGYLVYDAFSGNEKGLNGSAGQIEEALNRFKTTNKKKLILDLRNNGGGFVDIMREVSAHFIDAGNGEKAPVIVSIDKNNKEEVMKSHKVKYSDYNYEKIVVLANEGTASASEALIGAMLDYDSKGIVKVLVSSSSLNGEVVYKTYGKGIMQTTYKNLDGSAVKLTTAELYWPVSRICIHGVGIVGKDTGKILKVNASEAFQTALQM